MPAEGGLAKEVGQQIVSLEQTQENLTSFRDLKKFLIARENAFPLLEGPQYLEEKTALERENDEYIRTWIYDQLLHPERYDSIVKLRNLSAKKGDVINPGLNARGGWMFVNEGCVLIIEAADPWTCVYSFNSLKRPANKVRFLTPDSYEALRDAKIHHVTSCLELVGAPLQYATHAIALNDLGTPYQFISKTLGTGAASRVIHRCIHRSTSAMADFSDSEVYNLIRGIDTENEIEAVLKADGAINETVLDESLDELTHAPVGATFGQRYIDNSLEIG